MYISSLNLLYPLLDAMDNGSSYVLTKEKTHSPMFLKGQDPWLWPVLMIGIGGTIIPIVYSVACHFPVKILNDTYTSAT